MAALAGLMLPARTSAVPLLVNYQGRVAVDGANFTGNANFKFALVNAAGTVTYWSNDNTSVAGSPPAASVTLAVDKGLYSVLLGDTSLANMQAVPDSVFDEPDVRLRVWMNDLVHGLQLLTPDQRIATSGYAMRAANVDNGAISTAKLATGAVTTANLAPGATAPPIGAVGSYTAGAANANYSATSGSLAAIGLPASANVGDIVQVTGAGAGGWVLTPTNWTAADSPRDWRGIAASADGQRLVAAAFNGRLYTSTDRGATWVPRQVDRKWVAVASSADGLRLLAAPQDSADIYTSSNGGINWAPHGAGTAPQYTSVAMSTNGSIMFVAARGAGSGFLYVSTDGGVNFIPRVADASRNWGPVAASADGTRLVGAVTGGRFYTSSNSGTSFTVNGPTGNWVGLASSADGLKLAAVASGGTVYTSTDAGVNWTSRESVRNWTSIACSADGNQLVAVADAQLVRVSFDAGVTWSTQDSARAWTTVTMSSNGLVRAAAVNGGQIYVNGTTPVLSGTQGTTGQVQYLGNGNWAAVTAAAPASNLADGSVTSSKLAPSLALSGSFTVDDAETNAGTGPSPGLTFGSAASGEGIGSQRSGGAGQFSLSLYTSSTPRLTVLNNGNVGIGTTTPTLARLQVAGSVSTTISYAYLNSTGTVSTAPATSVPLSIHASDRVAASEFNAYSDARIKAIEGRSDSAADLRTLERIEVTDYTFRDRLAKGAARQKKVVAQQVEDVFPQAVARQTDVVPDIYRAADLRAGWIELPTDLRVGDRVRLISEKAQGIYRVTEVRPQAFRTEGGLSDGRVFVYGREVDDFRSVDYDAIAMLNVSATQELARQLAALQQRLAEREAEARRLSASLSDLTASGRERDQRLERLERLLTPTTAAQPVSRVRSR